MLQKIMLLFLKPFIQKFVFVKGVFLYLSLACFIVGFIYPSGYWFLAGAILNIIFLLMFFIGRIAKKKINKLSDDLEQIIRTESQESFNKRLNEISSQFEKLPPSEFKKIRNLKETAQQMIEIRMKEIRLKNK